MSITLYVATTNPGKLRDFEQATLSCRANVRILPLPPPIPPPLEDATTFEENAAAKAVAYSRYADGQIVLADDSGLEVDALGGAPGVRSARFAADANFRPQSQPALSTDECNNLLLMEKLRGVSQNLRSARYRCVLAAARDGACIHVAHGTVEGTILDSPRGSGGFGYDPLFFLPGLGRTMAEINLEEKHCISHRGNALRALLQQICG